MAPPRKAHVDHLRRQMQDGNVRPSVMKHMAKVATQRGEHETASRMNEAVAKHDQAAKSIQRGPQGGMYYVGANGEKVYVK